VAPFLGTRERLHSGAASLLVVLSVQFLKWQDPMSTASALLQLVSLGMRKFILNHETPLPTH
jgi:hypothetical protein